MLKGINPLLHPDLLHTLASMGHGDELVLADRNYPAASTGQRVLRLDGVGSRAAADAILELFPLDTFVDEPLLRMEDVDAPDLVLPVHADVLDCASNAEGHEVKMGSLERYAFYERARSAFAVVATGEARPYSCFIMVKGTVMSG